jgi:hypothetical protein
MVSQKKFYEGVAGEKKIAAVFSPEKIKWLRFLQLQRELSENDVILASVDEMYVKAIELTAVETGLIKCSTLTLSREDFADDALFNSICRQLNVFGPDGSVESVKRISFEVGKAFIPAA